MTLFSINDDDSRFVLDLNWLLLELNAFRLCQFSCKLCSYVTDWPDSCVRHMKKGHPAWKDELSGLSYLCNISQLCNHSVMSLTVAS